MSELPKIARDRLQKLGAYAQGHPLSHPDADLLTGFVERSISAKEREQVTEHLAVCADCREVLAMSLPATEAGELTQTGAVSSTRWSQWKLMRFGVGTATAAVIIAALVFFKVNQPSKPAELATVTSPSIEKAKVQESDKPDTAETRASNGTLTDGVAASSPTAAKKQAISKPAEAKVAAPGTKDGKALARKEEHRNDRVLDLNAGLMRPAISSPLSTATPVTPPAAAGNVAYDRFSNIGGRNEVAASAKRSVGGGILGGVATSGAAPAQPPSSGVRAMTTLPDANRPPQSSTEVQVQAQAAAPVAQQPTAAAETQARQISQADAVSVSGGQAAAADALKKSTGGIGPGSSGMTADDAASLRAAEAWSGKSSSAAIASGSANLFVPPQPSYAWRIIDGKLQRAAVSKQNQTWQDLSVAPGVKLDPGILSTSNTSVRVASGDGVLYYSNDNGTQWHQVKNWTGQIVRLVFFRTELGVLETSTGEKWVTGDSGATWHKQQ